MSPLRLTLALFVILAGCGNPPSPGDAAADLATSDDAAMLPPDLAGHDAAVNPMPDLAISDAAVAMNDIAVSPDLAVTQDLATADQAMMPMPDLAMADQAMPMPDLAMPPGPIQLVGGFHAGVIQGSANGIAIRGRFNWHTAVTGTANGITIRGVFY